MSESGQEAHAVIRDWWGGPHGYPQVVRNPLRCPGLVRRPTTMSGSGKLSRMSRSGREALVVNVREWSGAPQMFGIGREIFSHVQEWSGGPPGCQRVIGMPSRMSRSGREAIKDVRELLGGHARCPEVGGSPIRMSGSDRGPSQMSGSDREALPDVRE